MSSVVYGLSERRGFGGEDTGAGYVVEEGEKRQRPRQ